MDDLYRRFLPQFVTLARERVARALEVTVARRMDQVPVVMRELHTLAGEAGLLGLHTVVPLARDGEQKAKALHHSRADADAEVLVVALRELEGVIETIGAT